MTMSPTLPFDREEPPPLRAPTGSLPRDVLWGRGATGLPDALIMLVDDEPLNTELNTALLQQAGFRRFLHTERPEEAVDLMHRHQPRLVVLDVSMPRVSGFDILQAMREHPQLRHVPVIVVTSSGDARLRALQAGASDFLLKPVDPSELVLRIRNTLAATAYRDFLVQHDALTGLPNKLRYRQFAAGVVAGAADRGSSGALLHVGVDGLGRINDALGRAVGDQVLQRLAHRLASCVQTEADGELSVAGNSPSLYRYDGDEFAILVPRLESMEIAAAFISKLLDEGAVHFRRAGAPEVFVTCSIGVSVFPGDGTEPEVLMRNAGLALHHAKQSRLDRCEFYAPQFEQQALQRLDLGAELRGAITRGELELLFEPRIDLSTRRLAAAGAVVGWRHRSGRNIQGDELVDLASSAGMNLALVEWQIQQVRRRTREWQAAGLVPVPIGVNAPLAHIRPRDLAHLVDAALLAGVDARHLCIELQQVVHLDGLPQRDAEVLAALRRKGIRFALDRFGTVASVAHLRRLMVDELKVDASLVRDAGKDETAQRLLLGVPDLARRLRLSCVACGVESAQQLAFLHRHEWREVQGRQVGEPVAAMQFAAQWMEKKLPEADTSCFNSSSRL